MTPTHRTSISLIALAGALAVACSAAAQAAAPPAPPAPPAEARHHHEHMAEALRAILQLRPDQEAAFQAFQAAMAPPHPKDGPGAAADHAAGPDGRKAWGEHRDGGDREAFEHLTTPERLDQLTARLAKHEEALHRRIEAIKQFYAVLSPAQQKAFDALPMPLMHGPGMHGPGMGGPGMRMGEEGPQGPEEGPPDAEG